MPWQRIKSAPPNDVAVKLPLSVCTVLPNHKKQRNHPQHSVRTGNCYAHRHADAGLIKSACLPINAEREGIANGPHAYLTSGPVFPCSAYWLYCFRCAAGGPERLAGLVGTLLSTSIPTSVCGHCSSLHPTEPRSHHRYGHWLSQEERPILVKAAAAIGPVPAIHPRRVRVGLHRRRPAPASPPEKTAAHPSTLQHRGAGLLQ